MKVRIVPATELSTSSLRARDYIEADSVRPDASEVDRMIAVFNRQGWYPAKWSHHPKAIKDALRDIGLRPQIKQCFANCQRLLLSDHPIARELSYHEGYVQTVIPIQHAWLVYGQAIVDLTLGPRVAINYLDSFAYTREEVRRKVIKTLTFGPVSEVALALLSPFAAHFANLSPSQLDAQIEVMLEEGFEARSIIPLYQRVGVEVTEERVQAIATKAEANDEVEE